MASIAPPIGAAPWPPFHRTRFAVGAAINAAGAALLIAQLI